MPDAQVLLRPENCYHIYNHAVGEENLFEREADYLYFLSGMKKYFPPVSDILVYCLMPNHFHLVARMKEFQSVKGYFAALTKGRYAIEELIQQDQEHLSQRISQVYSNFFNAYSKHYNFVNARTGTLFKRTFRREEVKDLAYLRRLICYVHQNPVNAGFVQKPEDWKFSSYRSLLSTSPTLIPREEIIGLFGDLENFKHCHTRKEEIEIE
jgi:REP element-mobilizing transposase RayT